MTGSSGFLGQHLASRLVKDGHDLTYLNSKNCDLTNSQSLDKFNNVKYDKIYHLAAWTQAGDFCLRHPGEQWIINQKINSSVLTFWNEKQPQSKLITMGTSCSYDPDLELIEDNYLKGTPIDSLFTYAMTKRMMEVGLRSINKQFGLKYLTVVPSTLYGPGYHTDDRQLHFIFDLIRKILNAKYNDQEVVLWGNGHQKREIVYIDDFINDLLELDEIVDNDLVNIGAHEEHSIRNFAALISEIVDYDVTKIVYDENRYVGAESKFLNTEKESNLLGILKRTKISNGLETTIDWFQKNIINK
jgi:GDP-L-fucose synthase